MRRTKLLLATLAVSVALVAASPATAWADATGPQAVPTPAGKKVKLADQWAGAVEGTDAYISLFTLNNAQAGAYLADGADIATLVLGKRKGKALNLRPTDGTTVTAALDGDTVTGYVTIDGTDYAYTAERSTGDGGWYRGRKGSGAQLISAGFIVIADSTYRGAIREGGEVVATPDFDVDQLTLDVPSGGTIKVLPVAAFVKKEQRLA